jgi:predicted metal-dependent enzyme (double-stranded beta helix superfamily)
MFAVPPNTVALPATAAHPALIARDHAVNPAGWAHLLRFDVDERFTALVERTGEQEVWLMTWLPGQQTDLHDHGGSTGAFAVVSGALTELVARPGAHVSHRLVPGQVRVFGPDYTHFVRNTGTVPAVSVHVYRAERAMRSIRIDQDGGLSPKD